MKACIGIHPWNADQYSEEALYRLKDLATDAEVYLFGSYARGNWLEDSDVDIVVVSKGFEGESLPRRVGEVRKLAPEDLAFEILPYTPEELREAVEVYWELWLWALYMDYHKLI